MAVPHSIRGKTALDDLLNFGGTIAVGGTTQLALVQQPRRLWMALTNNSAADALFFGVGPARATAALTTGTVSAIAITNAGIGYTIAPQVRIQGGIFDGDYETAPGSTGYNQGQLFPGRPAVAVATIAGGNVNSITVTDPGSGYLVAPLIYLENPWPRLGGGAYAAAAGNGIAVAAGQTYTFTGSLYVPGSAVSVVGATGGDAFTITVGGLV
jgi:hypothetical protein